MRNDRAICVSDVTCVRNSYQSLSRDFVATQLLTLTFLTSVKLGTSGSIQKAEDCR